MSGKEAIHAVRAMTLTELRATFRTTDDATLRIVCGWRLTDRKGWWTLCREMGLLACYATEKGRSSRGKGFAVSVHSSITYAELRQRMAAS